MKPKRSHMHVMLTRSWMIALLLAATTGAAAQTAPADCQFIAPGIMRCTHPGSTPITCQSRAPGIIGCSQPQTLSPPPATLPMRGGGSFFAPTYVPPTTSYGPFGSGALAGQQAAQAGMQAAQQEQLEQAQIEHERLLLEEQRLQIERWQAQQPSAQQQPPQNLLPPPSRTDLSTAYCLGAISSERQDDNTLMSEQQNFPIASRDAFGKPVTAQLLANLTQRLHRLQGFLQPRLVMVNNNLLASATAQGHDDWAHLGRTYQKCASRCQSTLKVANKTAAQSVRACRNVCLEHSDSFQHLQKCSNLAFLPY